MRNIKINILAVKENKNGIKEQDILETLIINALKVDEHQSIKKKLLINPS